MGNDFKPHEIVWTHEKSSRVWDYYVHSRRFEGKFFSEQVGNDLIRVLRHYHDLKGNILDYGCGHGHLMSKLFKMGILAEGLEFSADSAKLVETNFASEKLFKGITLAEKLPSPLKTDQFDVVFFITAIEHLLPEDLHATLKEIHRITKKGGYVMVVTNNEENLEVQKVLCPECGCIFHTVQHTSSWTKSSLSSIMKDTGFEEVICTSTTFRGAGIHGLLLKILLRIESVVFGRKQPHLMYIGRKASSV